MAEGELTLIGGSLQVVQRVGSTSNSGGLKRSYDAALSVVNSQNASSLGCVLSSDYDDGPVNGPDQSRRRATDGTR